MKNDNIAPKEWDRNGLPGWTYFSNDLLDVENEELFRKHWQLVCHINDIPEPGDFHTYDIAKERAVVIRGHDRIVRAFHNLCRHRGARVVDGASGRCNKAMICPYHGWAYNLDGTLRGIAERNSFPPMNKEDWGLKPVEMEVWHGFIFIRFKPSKQPSVKKILERYEEEISHYKLGEMVPDGNGVWKESLDVNWKAIRDVDNEGYHVRQAHPGLHDLYGNDYFDEPYIEGASRSVGYFNGGPSKLWSIQQYKNILPKVEHLPPSNQQAWLYIGMFPNIVLGLYPDSVIYYQEVPVSATKTIQQGAIYKHREESREMRASRYLSYRIDRDTMDEDQKLCVWACEATQSSAYDGVVLSDLEYGLKTFHDHLREKIPAIKKMQEPAKEALWAGSNGDS